MSLQFITDSNGETTGVFIPINEWNKLKEKYKDIEQNSDWYNDISQQEKRAINKGLNDLENGKTHTSEDVRKSIRQRIENKSA